MNILRKLYQAQVNKIDDVTFEAVITTASVDRDGQIVDPAGIDTANYMKNPVVMYAHDYSQLPVAKTLELKPDGDALIAKFQFPPDGTYEFADTVRRMWAGGFLNATSIGFIPRKMTDEDGKPVEPEQACWRQANTTIAESELLEFSIVPVPANQDALRRALDAAEVVKGVIPYKKTTLADEGEAWDGPAEIAAAEPDDLKVMCAWFDSENADVKSAYKLPHHKADGHACVWRAVAAAMTALMGGRGGVAIPDGDKRGVYAHLAAHYKDFDKEAPEFREETPEDEDPQEKAVKEGRVLSGVDHAMFTDVVSALKKATKSIQDYCDAHAPEAKAEEPAAQTSNPTNATAAPQFTPYAQVDLERLQQILDETKEMFAWQK